MTTWYATTQQLRAAYKSRTTKAFDNYTLVSGEVGLWKSLWMRKFGAYVSKRALTLDCIHFTQDDWNTDFVSLAPGDSIVMDEWRAHKRQAMHGFRGEQLDTNKEGRQIGANAFFGYPDADEIDKDLLKRFEWWHHKPSREVVEIRRKVSSLMFDAYGKPFTDVKWPHVATFTVTGKNDPLRWPYEAKKEARMRDRAARFKENNREAPEGLVPAAKSTRIPPGLIAIWDQELGRS